MKHLESSLGYSFQNPQLLEEALTHPSVKRFSKTKFSYQRLELLGDKALGLIITKKLLEIYPSEEEGNLSKILNTIVAKANLCAIAKKLELGKFIILTPEMEEGRESENILENVLEALSGAIFLDGGLKEAESFVEKFFDLKISLTPEQDSKSSLQEWFQKKYKKTPVYNAKKQEDGSFEVALELQGKTFFGKGKSIKNAEKECAKNCLNFIKKKA